MARQDGDRLNVPGRRRRSLLPRIKFDRDAFGDFAEGFARFMGTARFLGWMTVTIICWVIWNSPLGPDRPRFDAYPFIFLTLVLSLQASYAAPLILLAQNRQEARDRVALEIDRAQTAQSRADMDFLAREIAGLRMSVGELATRDFLRTELRSELQSILDELDDDSTIKTSGKSGAKSGIKTKKQPEPAPRPSLRTSVDRRRRAGADEPIDNRDA